MAILFGKTIIRSDIRLVTGTRIGGSQGGMKIGGVDLNVISDPLGRPYLPGSSVKGKLRTLLERNQQVDVRSGSHSCKTPEDYAQCAVCRIFGTLQGFEGVPTLTRLTTRDTFLDEASITGDMQDNIDLKYSEVKYETAIDRVAGTALRGSLRQVERVPAGAVFRPCELVFNVFEEPDKDLLRHLFVAMELLEDDYLGGMGSRGYGKVKFENISVWWNSAADYEAGKVVLKDKEPVNADLDSPAKLVAGFERLKSRLS